MSVPTSRTGKLSQSQEAPTLALGRQAPLIEPPAVGTADTFGRYVVFEQLGAGGMGVVYRAYDPKLAREVAVKLLRLGADPIAKAPGRLLREAQAMAMLSHPNVVPVYDVQERDGQLFIVMEFVRGQTLRQWVRSKQPTWREALEAFRQAGRGLAAAHDAGLVHRDFKPGNALVGADGIVKVMDFGLARASPELSHADSHEDNPAAAADPAASGHSHSLEALSNPMTQAGTVVGTPSYMAPEQHRGQVADAKGDQYAFCVALYEALYGARPFAADDLKALVRAKDAGLPDEPPDADHAAVPRWVRRALRRGLDPAPQKRYRDMGELLSALSRDQTASRTARIAVGTAIIAAATAITIAVVVGRETPCSATPVRLEALWTDGDRSEVQAAFTRTDLPYATVAFAQVDGELHGYAAAWGTAYLEACEATHVRHEQSDSLLDRRMLCLDRRLLATRALVDVLRDADAAVVESAVQAIGGLPSIARCGDAVQLQAHLDPRPTGGAGDAVASLESRLANLDALILTGRFDAAEPLGIVAFDEAHAVGYRPLVAEAAGLQGDLLARRGRFEASAAALREGYFVGLRSGNVAAAVDCATTLTFVVGEGLGQVERAKAWYRHGDALREHAGLGEQARARLLNNYAAVLHRGAELDEALASAREALATWTELLPPGHIQFGITHNNIGNFLQELGRIDEAAQHYRSAIELWRAKLGEDHPLVATAMAGLASVVSQTERLEEGIEIYQRALEIRRRVLRPGHPELAASLNNLGAIQQDSGDYESALESHRAALAGFEAAHGELHPFVAVSLENMAWIFTRMGRLDEADRVLTRAQAIRAEVLEPGHPHIASGQLRRGELLLAQDRATEAVAPLEAAFEIRQRGATDPYHLAETGFGLAQALWADPASRPRAAALAARCAAIMEAMAPRGRRLRSEVIAWMGERARAG